MKSPESQLQQSCVQHFRWKYPLMSNRLWAIPNGGARNIVTAARLKREGVLAGVPDLFLSLPNRWYSGMFIEMKSEKGKLTEAQQRFIDAHKKDYYCVVVKDVNEFLKEIDKYFKENLDLTKKQ